IPTLRIPCTPARQQGVNASEPTLYGRKVSCLSIIQLGFVVPLISSELLPLPIHLSNLGISLPHDPHTITCEQFLSEGQVIVSPASNQGAGIIRPRPRRSQMIGGRVFVFAAVPHLGGRNQTPALVKIMLYYNVFGIVPFCDQFASRAVLKPRRHAADDLLHPTAVPVVNVLARHSACNGGHDQPALGVVSINLFGLLDKVPGGVIGVSIA